ncbi:A disintegrin and metalloproteinase with thrombospondin motifs adt-1 [Lingula anatina]|uniref:A disintegrin and metalloproteinase with thrombospondin motifs adt-1 n=1 Tax=Lingula anatina TaxID=7574 RepID=A0A1S3J9F7_LINAN|nr:A disintegrin and metalloproteinase with thrombospondin motifs adt-1 [Lingula anatina]|eukprot:XP_013406504.1 A disintegrin and metalloproteinase with thrombospondin motifs adt-1 [Lingula anatina]
MASPPKTLTLCFTACILSSVVVAAQVAIQQLTRTELQEIFGVQDHSKVPDYSLTEIHEYQTRGASNHDGRLRMSMKVGGRLLRLHLSRNDDLVQNTLVTKLSVNDDGQTIEENVTGKDDVDGELSQLYEDPVHSAAFTIQRDASGLLLDGSVGDYVVRTLPDHVTSNSSLRHVVYRQPDVRFVSDEYYPPDENTSANITQPRGLHKRQVKVPAIVYAEVTLIVAHSVIRNKGSEANAKKYVLNYWNSVSSNYKSYKMSPDIRFKIKEFIMCSSPTAAMCNGIDQSGSLGDVLQRMVDYLKPRKKYDIAVAHNCANGWNRGDGMGAVAKACDPWAVGVVSDDCSQRFTKLHLHETGHILGSPHDGDSGMPCDRSAYLMTPNGYSTSHLPSPCTRAKWSAYWSSSKGACMHM